MDDVEPTTESSTLAATSSSPSHHHTSAGAVQHQFQESQTYTDNAVSAFNDVDDWFSLKRSSLFIAEKTCEMVCYVWFSSLLGPSMSRHRSRARCTQGGGDASDAPTNGGSANRIPKDRPLRLTRHDTTIPAPLTPVPPPFNSQLRANSYPSCKSSLRRRTSEPEDDCAVVALLRIRRMRNVFYPVFRSQPL